MAFVENNNNKNISLANGKYAANKENFFRAYRKGGGDGGDEEAEVGVKRTHLCDVRMCLGSFSNSIS